MAILIEMTNNPYRQRMQLLIDGRPVSAYSRLVRFMDEPFVYWCSRILEALYEECNHSPFQLRFCSREEELAVMAVQARRSQYCESYTPVPILREEPLTKRMAGLNRLIRQDGLTGFRTFRRRAVFLLPPGAGPVRDELLGLQVQNAYCRIDAEVMEYSQYQSQQNREDVCFLLDWNGTVREALRRLGLSAGFGIQIGGKAGFLGICGGVLCYGTPEEQLIDTVFRCLQMGPLTEIFCACMASIPEDVRARYRSQLEALELTTYRILPQPQSTTIEVGSVSRISFQTDVPGCQVDSGDLAFDYSKPGILSCDGSQVTGLKAGSASLKIYRKGERQPFAVIAYQVIRRNRITELILEEEALLLGEGDRSKLHVTFLPEDADNAASIRWRSDNPAAASVDQDGRVYARSCGVCRIVCQAEGVSVSVPCQVKPHLNRILLKSTDLAIPYGETADIVWAADPADCIDGEIEMESLDMQIANVIGHRVKAVGVGTTRIIVQNVQGTVRREVTVTVPAPPGRSSSRSKGLLSRLLGSGK